jgi:hypothetical protein
MKLACVITAAKPQPDSSTQEVLVGLVERVTSHTADDGFCVIRIKARGTDEVVTSPRGATPPQTRSARTNRDRQRDSLVRLDALALLPVHPPSNKSERREACPSYLVINVL